MVSLGLLPLFCLLIGICAAAFQTRRSVLSTIVVAAGFGWMQGSFLAALGQLSVGAYVWFAADTALCVAAGLLGHWLVARKRWRDAPRNR